MPGLGGRGGSDVCFYQSISWPEDIWQCLCPSISWPALLTMCPSTSWLTHLSVFVLIHLMTVLLRITMTVFVQTSHDLQTHLTNGFISWPADAFNSVCVLPSQDLQTLLSVLCSSISWPADAFNNVCVHPSHDLRHFWQCLCPSISWPADTFDSVFVHLMTCTLLTVCLHPSHDLQTLLTMFVSDHLMTCRHFWQCLCPSISWPADTFDSGFTSIHLMTFRHFLRWALLSLDNTTFSFSIFCKLFPRYNLILMPLFCISDTMTKTRSPRVVPKFDDARESSRALVDDKESKTAADQRARNKLTS